jgi:catechol 2,3-dioxygenase-like lactoylglutathione lyase family enzyme
MVTPARIRHIALTTEDPFATAEFYKNTLGLTELYRDEAGEDGKESGVWLSDGYIYLAILKYAGDNAPNTGTGPPTIPGFHHFGVQVDSCDESGALVEAEGGELSRPIGPGSPARQYAGPEGVIVELAEGALFDELIAKWMPLLYP